MKVDARMTAEPALHGWTFVRAQIVEDDVNRVVGGRRRLDPVEKPDEFLGVALRAARAEDGAIQDPQRGIQTRRPVADVIVGLPLRHLAHERQHRARPIQCLNPALLIDAEDHRFVGRIEIQAHDIAQLVDKPRVFRTI